MLTVIEFANKFRLHPDTVRINAAKLGGFKVLGRWRFPDTIPSGLALKEKPCLTSDQKVTSSGFVSQEYAALVARPSGRMPKRSKTP